MRHGKSGQRCRLLLRWDEPTAGRRTAEDRGAQHRRSSAVTCAVAVRAGFYSSSRGTSGVAQLVKGRVVCICRALN